MSIFDGLHGLLASRKATFCIVILATSAAVAITGHMDPAFAAIVGTISTIYLATHTATDIAQIKKGNP